MALAKTLQQYLDQCGIEYGVLSHPPTPSASRTAQASHVSGENIVKGVLLKDPDGYVLAILPASCHLRLPDVEKVLEAPVALATEPELDQIFADCELGAIPAVGAAYGLDMLVDEAVMQLDEIFFEGGDHETLVRVSADDFKTLLGDVQWANVARHD